MHAAAIMASFRPSRATSVTASGKTVCVLNARSSQRDNASWQHKYDKTHRQNNIHSILFRFIVLKVALRRQQAQEENEARELSVLYGTSCETILALKRSLQATENSDTDHNNEEDGDDDLEGDEGDVEHDESDSNAPQAMSASALMSHLIDNTTEENERDNAKNQRKGQSQNGSGSRSTNSKSNGELFFSLFF